MKISISKYKLNKRQNNKEKSMPRNTWKKSIGFLLACVLMAVILLPLLPAQTTKADYVTDWIAVRVGYSGMELSEYVLVDNFHFSDFETGDIAPLHTVFYSYFQGDGQTVSGTYKLNNVEDQEIYSDYIYDNAEYTSIVAAGWGFYVQDLLDYCKIYYGDIYNILFYVNDHETIWTALDKDSLFRQRYYFYDLPGHRNTVYNDFYSVIGYDFQGAWEDAVEVQPMLALESNWDSINEKIEHHEGTEVGMSAGYRFRLLYGQTSPTERITRESAEYVSCVYVTLNGKAEFGEMPELDTEMGSHTVEMQVSTDNSSIRDALSELMQLNSTNENVLVIKGYTLTPSDIYSDIATITIDYEIVGVGDASISASIGHGANAQTETVASTPDEPESVTPEPTTEPETEKATESPAGENPTGTNGSGGTTQATGASNTNTAAANDADNAEVIDEAAEAEEVEVISNDQVSIYKLADGIMPNLNELVDSSVTVPPDRDITQVVVEDNTEEEEEKQRLILMWTGIVALAVCALGFGVGYLAFRLRLRYNGIPSLAPLKRAMDRFFFGVK